MALRLVDHPRIGLPHGTLKVGQGTRRVCRVGVKPLQPIDRELLDGLGSQRAGPLPRLVAAHAVGHQKEMRSFIAGLQLRPG